MKHIAHICIGVALLGVVGILSLLYSPLGDTSFAQLLAWMVLLAPIGTLGLGAVYLWSVFSSQTRLAHGYLAAVIILLGVHAYAIYALSTTTFCDVPALPCQENIPARPLDEAGQDETGA